MLRCRGPAGLACLLLLLAPATSRAITAGAFTASGTYLRPSGAPSPFTIGSGGAVEEIEAFLAGPEGPVARLSSDAPPAGVALSFQSILSPDATDLRLVYEITNLSVVATPANFRFVSFVDAEIDEALNTFFNEYAETEGALAAGRSFEIDEPGFVFGDIFDNARAANLDGTNAVPSSAPEDVSMALAFTILNLAPGQTARFELMLSEDGDSLGGFAIRQRDADARSDTVITFSGVGSIVPEPGTAALIPSARRSAARRAARWTCCGSRSPTRWATACCARRRRRASRRWRRS